MNTKPFIHLFTSPYNYYFYDVNTNQICKIDEDVYEYLDKEQKNEKIDADTLTLDKINKMKAQGLLSYNRLQIIEHPDSQYLKDRLNNNIRKITLQLTQNCNLRCTYCIYSNEKNSLQRSHSNKRMSWEIAKKGIDFLFEHSTQTSQVNIGFYGGEPLLEFNMIKKCIKYCNENNEGKKMTFGLTTNGTLFTDEMTEYLMENDVKVLISLDGPEKIHNKQRRFAADGCGSFNKVWENIQYISRKYPRFIKNISFSAVVDPQADYQCIHDFFSCEDIFKEINARQTLTDYKYDNKTSIIKKEYFEINSMELFKVYLHKMGIISGDTITRKAMSDFQMINRNIKLFVPSYAPIAKVHPSGPCIPGMTRLFIDVNGNFFPCERVSELSQAMNIGNLVDGFDFDKCYMLLNVGQTTSEKCKDCWAFRKCGLCCTHSDDGDALSNEKRIFYCKQAIKSAEAFLKDYVLEYEINTIFKPLISKIKEGKRLTADEDEEKYDAVFI